MPIGVKVIVAMNGAAIATEISAGQMGRQLLSLADRAIQVDRAAEADLA